MLSLKKTHYYYGGEYNEYNDSHYNKWLQLKMLNEDPPKYKNHCLCGHEIIYNCYIKHKINENLEVVGSCCIKKFIGSFKINCSKCGEKHNFNKEKNICTKCNNFEKKFQKIKIKFEKKIENVLIKKQNEIKKIEMNIKYQQEKELEQKRLNEIYEYNKNLLSFGKYKDEHLNDIFLKDIKYIIWLIKQEWFKFKNNKQFLFIIELIKIRQNKNKEKNLMLLRSNTPGGVLEDISI